MRLASAEHHLHAVGSQPRFDDATQRCEQLFAAPRRRHHRALTDREHLPGQLVEERLQPVLADLPVRETRATPRHAQRADDLVPVDRIANPAPLVLRIAQPPVDPIGDARVAAHLLDVDGVAEAEDRFFLIDGFGDSDLNHEMSLQPTARAVLLRDWSPA